MLDLYLNTESQLLTRPGMDTAALQPPKRMHHLQCRLWQQSVVRLQALLACLVSLCGLSSPLLPGLAELYHCPRVQHAGLDRVPGKLLCTLVWKTRKASQISQEALVVRREGVPQISTVRDAVLFIQPDHKPNANPLLASARLWRCAPLTCCSWIDHYWPHTVMLRTQQHWST